MKGKWKTKFKKKGGEASRIYVESEWSPSSIQKSGVFFLWHFIHEHKCKSPAVAYYSYDGLAYITLCVGEIFMVLKTCPSFSTLEKLFFFFTRPCAVPPVSFHCTKRNLFRLGVPLTALHQKKRPSWRGELFGGRWNKSKLCLLFSNHPIKQEIWTSNSVWSKSYFLFGGKRGTRGDALNERHNWKHVVGPTTGA